MVINFVSHNLGFKPKYYLSLVNYRARSFIICNLLTASTSLPTSISSRTSGGWLYEAEAIINKYLRLGKFWQQKIILYFYLISGTNLHGQQRRYSFLRGQLSYVTVALYRTMFNVDSMQRLSCSSQKAKRRHLLILFRILGGQASTCTTNTSIIACILKSSALITLGALSWKHEGSLTKRRVHNLLLPRPQYKAPEFWGYITTSVWRKHIRAAVLGR